MAKERKNKYSTARIIFLAKAEERLGNAITKLQVSLWSGTQDVIARLVTKDGKIVTTAKNYSVIGAFNRIARSLKGEKRLLVKAIMKDMIAQEGLATDYFRKFLNLEKETVEARIYARLLDRIGYDGKGFVDRGTLYDLWTNDNDIRAVRAQTVKAIAAGQTFEQFQKQMREYVNGNDDRLGITEAEFKTVTRDIYAQNDRALTKEYADEYDLDYFIYQGGLMNTSRDFCRQRNGKVFTRDEVESWADINFEGKPKVYDPFLDAGGHNCRHTLDPISEEVAIQLRPSIQEEVL